MNKALSILLGALAGAAVGGLICLPNVIHALEGPAVSVSIEQLAAQPLPSHHLSLTGRPQFDIAVRQTVTRKNSQVEPEVSMFLPLVGAAWQPGDEIPIIVQAYGYKITQLIESAQQGQTISISGTVRNVAWEGLDSKVRGTFKDAGVLLPERVLLFEAEGAASTSDHFRALFGLIVGALLGALAGRNFKPEGESSSTLAMADAAE
jgi:hypothetical protein